MTLQDKQNASVRDILKEQIDLRKRSLDASGFSLDYWSVLFTYFRFPIN